MLKLRVIEKFAGWEGWLAPAGSKGWTSKVYLWLPRKLRLSNERGQATLPNLRICSRGLSLRYGRISTAKLILTIILAATALGGCNFRVAADHSSATTAQSGNPSALTQEDKHRLYTAALAASDSPLDSELFKEVCQKIGIFDTDGYPNESYMTFVQQHVKWGMKTETNQFRSEVNTKERAQEYVQKHLP